MEFHTITAFKRKQEIHIWTDLRAKSIKVYNEKYKPEISLRTSLSDYREEQWLVNLPLYALAGLNGLVNNNILI